MNIAETTSPHPLRYRSVPTLHDLPRPVYARVEDIAQPKATQPHSHPWIQLSYASRGVLQIRTAEGWFLAPPQWAILVPPSVEHAVFNSPGTEMRSLYIATDAMPAAGDNCQVLAVSGLLREMIRHFSRLPAEYDEEGAQGRLVDVMLDLVCEAPREAFSLPWPAEPGLRDICSVILAAPQQPLRMDEWSAQSKVSVRTLERQFLQQTGLNMRRWRLRARLLRALPLLERGDSVTDVALGCGYESTSSFIAAFRQFFGVTPGRFTPQGSRKSGRSGS
ncbi:MAG: AraC family transcriptional regulator [Alcaligenaceae bacterium]|nr:AraC family transcriptional regulator [Alcaligenaceae bacterium]